MADIPNRAAYDPADPANHPAAGAPQPDVWIEDEGHEPTANPDGMTVSNVDYHPKTQEEKAELMGIEFAPAVSNVVQIEPTRPYPEGRPPFSDADRQWVLDQAHTKQEQVEEKDRWRQDTENLRAGGQLAEGAKVR